MKLVILALATLLSTSIASPVLSDVQRTPFKNGMTTGLKRDYSPTRQDDEWESIDLNSEPSLDRESELMGLTPLYIGPTIEEYPKQVLPAPIFHDVEMIKPSVFIRHNSEVKSTMERYKHMMEIGELEFDRIGYHLMQLKALAIFNGWNTTEMNVTCRSSMLRLNQLFRLSMSGEQEYEPLQKAEFCSERAEKTMIIQQDFNERNVLIDHTNVTYESLYRSMGLALMAVEYMKLELNAVIEHYRNKYQGCINVMDCSKYKFLAKTGSDLSSITDDSYSLQNYKFMENFDLLMDVAKTARENFQIHIYKHFGYLKTKPKN